MGLGACGLGVALLPAAGSPLRPLCGASPGRAPEGRSRLHGEQPTEKKKNRVLEAHFNLFSKPCVFFRIHVIGLTPREVRSGRPAFLFCFCVLYVILLTGDSS